MTNRKEAIEIIKMGIMDELHIRSPQMTLVKGINNKETYFSSDVIDTAIEKILNKSFPKKE